MLLWCELWSDLKFYFFKEGSEKIFLSESSRLGPAGTCEFTVTIKSNSSLYGSIQYFAQIQVRSIQACVGRQQSIANKITKRAERNLCFKLLKNTPNVVQFKKQALKVTIFKRSGLFLTILVWVLLGNKLPSVNCIGKHPFDGRPTTVNLRPPALDNLCGIHDYNKDIKQS